LIFIRLLQKVLNAIHHKNKNKLDTIDDECDEIINEQQKAILSDVGIGSIFTHITDINVELQARL
jgi:hypothetical protein